MKYLPPVIIFLVCTIRLAAAQEVQVPFDSAGKIMVITEELESQLHLFKEFPDFSEARLFRTGDSSYILEITSLRAGKTVRNRENETPKDVLELQKAMRQAAEERSPSMFLDQTGRSKFLLTETLLGAFVYAPFIIAAINPDNASTGVGLELVIGGLNFFVPYVATRNIPMTAGDASFALGSAVNGGLHGLLIDVLATGGSPGNEAFALVTLSSIAETWIGYSIANSYHFSEGKAGMINYGGLFGLGDGALLSLAINPDNPSATLAAGLALAGSAAGYYAGALLAADQPYTGGNATAAITSGVYGTFLFPLLYGSVVSETQSTNSNIGRGFALSGIAGNIGGTLLGHALMKGRSLSSGEGTDVALGTTAGFLIGYGLGFLLNPNFGDNVSVWSFTIPITLCTAASYGIMLAVIGKGKGGGENTGWNMNINPTGLLGSLLPQKSANSYTAPFVNLQYKW